MSDLLSTSVSGLLAFQQALDVTSNNVANVATPGYSVESVDFTPQPGQSTPQGYVGSGVAIAGITRTYDELLARQVRSSQASYSSFNALATQATQIDNMLSASDTGLSASLQSFVNAVQTVANTPTSTAARQALLSQAQALAQQLTSYDGQIAQYGADLESQIASNVTQINTLAGNIATVNAQIAKDLAGGAQTPNALMDQRDQLIDQLSQYVSVNTAAETNGELDVYIGSGQALVNGSTAQKLTTVQNAYDASVSDIALTSGNSTADVTSEISGGSLGGLLAARTQVLDPARNALGQLSVALATIVNQQQQAGMDLTGAQGQPMFAVGGVQTLADVNNTGTATVSATRGSLAALTTDDYVLKFSGGSWQLEDQTTGQPVALTGSGTNASPFQAAGLSIIVSGAAANGDSFEIRPTAAATSGLSVLLTSPTQIAAASLVQSAAGTGNTGTGTIAAPSITNPAAWVPDTYTISFTSPTQYQVSNSSNVVIASGTYTAGSPISFPGAQVTISGAPAAGDNFTISNNGAANTGDNSNAFAIVDALAAASLDAGTTSVSGAANNLVSQIGVVTQQAQANASAQHAVNQDAVSARNNLSGVNLDEEAANMVRYQQAYSAMAQMIAASSQMFTSLMNAIAYR